MIALLFALTASAEPVGYHHPTDVAAASAEFRRCQDSAGVTFQSIEDRASGIAAALVTWEENLDLLGDRAPAAEREALEAARTRFDREMAVLQGFAGDLVDGFQTSFGDALDRQLERRGEVAECRPRQQSGPRSRPSFGGGGSDAPDTCPGADLNAELAAAMDADPALVSAIDALLAREWPTLSTDFTPRPVIGEGSRALDVGRVFRSAGADALRSITQQDEDARLPLQAALEQDADEATLARLAEQGRAITARTAAARAAWAAPVLTAMQGALATWTKRGEPATAWCATPQAVGGCDTPDATSELLDRLLAEPKVKKALR